MITEKLIIKDSIQYIKYMGSKTKILPFVIDGIEDVYEGGSICDLFSGSCSLSGAIGDQVPVISNDIQEYSAIIAKSLLTDWYDQKITSIKIIEEAKKYHSEHFKSIVEEYNYPKDIDLDSFNQIERKNQELINFNFSNKWHLFTKYYSGTWWSAEQCSWIDSLRKVIEDYRDNPAFNTILSSLMYAMAYNSQGTGHYAQFRDAKTNSTMKDIQIYRGKSILDYFKRKLNTSLDNLPLTQSEFNHEIITKDYIECLKEIKNCTVYADPPYCFVHYSRFYHALETIVLYDYPELQHKNGKIVKGRYRENRHQSPFCIRTKVSDAFDDMFKIINKNGCSLVLSYSDTGMITLNELLILAKKNFTNHSINVKSMDHAHMTMGRQNDRDREVKELLILIKPY